MNAKKHLVPTTIFRQGDFFQQKKTLQSCHSNGKQTVLVCNPPYISDSDYANLESQILDHEPITALKAGPKGIEFYDKLLSFLKPFCLTLICEIGIHQRPPLENMFKTYQNEPARFVKDFHGIYRVFILNKTSDILDNTKSLNATFGDS